MNYHNEFDKNAAAWTRQLIADGLIPPGEVDERSITDVTPNDLRGYTQCHFFGGISGWSLALQLAGWPADRPVWTGSCPCQPFSVAGKGKGTADERHLWPHLFRLIRECRPPVVFGEQVASADVIGKRASLEEVRQVLDRKAVLGILLESRQTEEFMSRLQKCTDEIKEKIQLPSAQNREKGADIGGSGEIQGERGGDSIQLGSRGYTEKDRCGIVRTDGNSLRSENTEGLEYTIIGSNNSSGRIYTGQCSSGDLCGECDESQLGAEFDTEDCRGDQGSPQNEIERLIQQIGGITEESNGVWVDGIQHDLEEAGYAFGASVLGASSLGAPHQRNRLYWVADAGRQRDERWGINSVVAGQGGAAEGEAWQRERSGDAGGDSLPVGSMADCQRTGLQGHGWDGHHRNEPGWIAALQTGPASEGGGFGALDNSDSHGEEWPRREEQSTLSGCDAGFWSDSRLILCRDGKARRIPTQSLFQHVADGVPPGMDNLRSGLFSKSEIEGIAKASGGFPLAEKISSRAPILKGAGNAIVPQVAALFIQAFLESKSEIG